MPGSNKAERDEPEIWFESLQSMAQALSSENQELLKINPEQKPESLKELETATGGRRTRHGDDIPRLKAEDLRFFPSVFSLSA